MAWSILLLLPFLVSLLLCRLLMAVSVRDGPDGERKLQAAPVPTAGGIGILAGIVAPLALMAVLTGANPLSVAHGLVFHQPYGSWVLLVLGLGLLGAIDDGVGLPASLKLVVLVAASVAAATQLPAVDLGLPWLATPAFAETSDTAGVFQAVPLTMTAGIALWILVFVNATNFMDGADGLAFGSLAIMLAGLGIGLGTAYWPMVEFIDPVTWAMLLTPAIAIMAIAGFLVWNLRGRLYAGDTGSLALGGLFAVMAAYTGAHFGIWYPLILALPFTVDVGMTLLYRTVRRQPLLRPHLDHAYQLFIRRGASPVRVAMLWWAFSAICLAASVSILRQDGAGTGYGAILFAALAAIGMVLWLWQRWAMRSRAPRQPPERVRLSETKPASEAPAE